MALAFRPALSTRQATSPPAPARTVISSRPGTPRFLQKKALEVDAEGSPLEREADALAEQILRTPEGSAPARIASAARGAGADGADGNAALPTPGPAVRAALAAGGGNPLPETARAYFEPRLGADLSAVRVHTGPVAGAAASEIRAQAFTRGQDIYFGRGRFAPESSHGRRLLAHELVHTAQQAGGDLIQADFESDFAGRTDVRVSEAPVRPPDTVRVTNPQGEEVWAPYGIYRPSEVPAPYQDRFMESGKAFQWRHPELPLAEAYERERARGPEQGRLAVRDMTRLAAGHGRAMNVRVMMARVGNDYRFVGYDMYAMTHGVMEHGFVESGRGTGYVAQPLFADRVVRTLQAGASTMKLEVYAMDNPRIADFHARIWEVIGRQGRPSEGQRYDLTPREMIRLALAWHGELSPAQRSQLTALAAGGLEPAPADVQRVLSGTPPPGRGGGAPGRGGGTPPAAPPTAPPSRSGGPTTTETETATGPKPVKGAPSADVARQQGKPGFKPEPKFPLGRQIRFQLTHFGAMILLEFVMAHVMAKIERSMFEKDCKALELQIQTAVNQRQGEIAGLLKQRKRIYANVTMEVRSNFVPSYDWSGAGGSWRYFTTQLTDVTISTDDINRTFPVYVKTVVTTLWNHRPFTYSFPLGDPIMAEDMPAGTQQILDYIASVLLDISRSVSVAGSRFDELNKNLDAALRMLGKLWEEDWTKTAVMTDAERFKALKAAVDRAVTDMYALFGPDPAGEPRQMLAMLLVVQNQLTALDNLWPLRFEEGTWHGSTP